MTENLRERGHGLKHDMLEIPSRTGWSTCRAKTPLRQFREFLREVQRSDPDDPEPRRKDAEAPGQEGLHIVNYDKFHLLPELVEEYAEMVK